MQYGSTDVERDLAAVAVPVIGLGEPDVSRVYFAGANAEAGGTLTIDVDLTRFTGRNSPGPSGTGRCKSALVAIACAVG